MVQVHTQVLVALMLWVVFVGRLCRLSLSCVCVMRVTLFVCYVFLFLVLSLVDLRSLTEAN